MFVDFGTRVFRRILGAAAVAFAIPMAANATPFTSTVPATGVALPAEYPEAGGAAIVLTGANGNIYYQFSDPDGAFIGFQYRGQPARFRGNPFTINDPLTLDCGFRSCSDYFGGSIARVDIRFSAYDGDTQPGGFDENDISLRLNGFDVGSWSGIQTEITNTDGTQSFGFATGFGNRTFDTAWFSSTNSALLANILTTGQTSTQVFDADPDDNYWDFTRGPSLPQEDIRTVAPGYELDKILVGGATGFVEAGQVLTYEYEVRNIGSVDIDNITVSDDKIPNVICPAPPNNSLEQTETGSGQPNALTCTGTYVVTQADVDAGTLTNVAVANGDPEFGELGALQDSVTLDGPVQTNAVTITKEADTVSFSTVGETITYTFTVANTGNTTLRNLSVSDPLIPGLSCAFPQIEPLSAANTTNTATCSGTYRVLQSDVDAFALNGTALTNTATVAGTAPDGGTVSNSASEDLSGPVAAPVLTIEKTALQADFDTVGDLLDFQIAIRNTGNVTWPGAPDVTDMLTGGASCPAGAVAPGAQIICTAQYSVDQDDLDAGSVLNEVSASITLNGATASGASDVRVSADITTGLTLLKRLQAASPDPYSAIGDALIYDYVLTNTGNVTLSDPSVSDNLVAVTCPAGPIAPMASVTCTSAAYVIDLADLDAGSVTNTAQAQADVAGGGVLQSPQVALTVMADQNPAMSMVKSAPEIAPIDFVDGAQVTYTYDVTNTGNVTLDGPISVVDDRINGGLAFACAPGPIAPMSDVQCSAIYTVTVADVINGFVTNTAFATDGVTQSNSDSATIPQEGTPAITLDKSAITTSFDATTDNLTYGFEVRNTGDVTIVLGSNPLTLSDPGVTFTGCVQPALLYPEGSANTPTSYSCTGVYSGLTQADLDAGEYANRATVSFPYTPPSGGSPTTVTSAPATAVIPADITPAFAFTKSSTDDYAAVGDIVTYTFTATNQTNQTLSQVVVTDPLIPSLTCTLSNIGPLGTDSCTGSYVVDQADLDRGQIDNTATAVATSPLGVVVTEDASAQVTIDPAAQTRLLSLTKTPSATGFTGVGDQIDYTLQVRNDGNLTLRDIVIADPDLGLTCTIPVLAPLGVDASCVGSRIMTQADVDAGSYQNTATAQATGVAPTTVTVAVPGPARAASWVFTKTADTTFQRVGDRVRFTLSVENTGNVSLNNIVLTDPWFDPNLSCAIGTLLPGLTDTSCTATYVVDQDDIDAGEILNTATLIGTGIDGAPITDTAMATVDGPAPLPSLSVAKTRDLRTGVFAAGVDETYSFVVENTGNVRLSNVSFSDPLTGFSCLIGPLDPGQSVSQCADGTDLRDTYTPLQSDVDAGALTNTAIVTGQTTVGATPVSANDTLTLTGPDQLPALSLVKTPTTGSTFVAVDEVVLYDYTVTNSGNITINQPITVTDDLTVVTCPSPAAPLAPGASTVCTASYEITQADLDNGGVTNTAEALVSQPVVPSASYPSGTADITSGPVQATVTADQLPALAIIKRLRPGTPTTFDGLGDLADVSNPNNLIFEFLVTNTGNVTTTAPIEIADSAIPTSLTCAAGPVAPGDQVTCSALWPADQAAIDAGSFTNTATASTVFDGATVTTPVPGAATAFAIQLPELTIFKQLDGVTGNSFNFGETASYTFNVTNTGNTTITAPISVNDNQIASPIACGALDLLPGDMTSCSASYAITLDDVRVGSLTNIATATNGTTTSAPMAATIPDGADPAIGLVKTADVASFAAVNDPIVYTFVVTNETQGSVRPAFGNTITVFDDRIGPVDCTPSAPLAAGASFSCSATYLVTQADLDAVAAGSPDGFVTNNAFAQTNVGTTVVVSDPDQVTVQGVSTPALDVIKAATNITNPGQPARVDDVLNFEITVRNIGNQTVAGVLVTDPMLDGLVCTIGVVDPANITIAPGAAIVCNGTYTVEQTDLDGQSIANTASAEGSTPQGTIVADTGSTTYPVSVPMPLLTVTKSVITGATLTEFTDVGQVVSFRVAVLNQGNITVDGITVTDSLIPGICTVGTLAPGESDDTCIFDYTVTQPDIDRGQIDNEASASGIPQTGGTITGTDTAVAGGPNREPNIGLAKSGAGPLATGGFDAEGQIISYLYTVANLGNVTLTETPVITDNLIATADIICDPLPLDGLAPTEELLCRAEYTATQDDVDRGFVTNIADVTMVNEYGGPALTASNSATVASERAPGLSIVKTASDMSNVAAGQDVTYSYDILNTGNVRLFDVTLDDQHSSASGTAALTIADSPVAVILPGETIRLTATYRVTQADIDAGAPLTNIVTATSLSPAGTEAPSATDDASVSLIASDGALEVIKTLPSVPPMLAAGTDLTFQITVRNTGNVTLTAPALVDTVSQVGALSPLPTQPQPVFQSGDAGQAGLLDVGETWTYTAVYALTQDDIDAGGITNSVTASAVDPFGTSVSDVSDNGAGDGDDPTGLNVAPAGDLTVLKTVRSIPVDPSVDDLVVFDVSVRNSGNVTLTTPVLTDTIQRADGTLIAVSPEAIFEGGDTADPGALNVGETWTYRVDYALTQGDIDAGGVSNSVLAAALDPNGAQVSDLSDTGLGDGDDPTPALLSRTPALNVIKTVSAPPTSAPRAGDIVGFEIVVTNAGNVTLTEPVLTDTLMPLGGAALTPAPVPQFDRGDSNDDDLLSVGERWVYVLNYELTQTDIDAGGVSNSVLAEATDPAGGLVDDVSDNGAGLGSDPTIVTLQPAAGIVAVKTIIGSPLVPDDVVTFEIAVTNTGNVTLTGVGVQSDTLTRADATPLALASNPTFVSANNGSPEGRLGSGETALYRATYILEQGDIDAGGLSNTATVVGTPPGGGGSITDVSDFGAGDGDDPTELTITPAPVLTLIKTLASGGPTVSAVDDILTFEFEVRNAGNVTIAGPISIIDPLITDAGGTVTCPALALAPGDALTCEGSYAVTQGDLDAGEITNTATATDGTTTSDPSRVTVLADQLPALETVKEAISITVAGTEFPGVASENYVVDAVVSYTFTVTNTGNVTITQPVSVSDNLIATVTCPALPAAGLAPMGQLVCTGEHLVTADDVILTSVTNLASATDGTTISPLVSETVPADGEPSLEITKTLTAVTNPDASPAPVLEFDEVGDVLTYQYEVRNSGQVSFGRQVTVQDDKLADPLICFSPDADNPDLVPGETVICEADYVVTQADLDDGFVTNTANAETVFGADRIVVSDPVMVTALVAPNPAISLSKSVATLPVTAVGQEMTYTLEAQNTGNQTLRQISLTDPLLPGFVCTAQSLSPGDTLTCSGAYTISQDDVDAGEVVNTANVTALSPASAQISQDARLVTQMPNPAPGLELTKSASVEPFGAADSTIEYRFAVANTGNVTLTDVTLTDALIDPTYVCTIPRLAVGEVNTQACVFSYTVTQADVDAGSILNSASVEGTDPNGTRVTASDTLSVSGTAAEPRLEATKMARLMGDGLAGSDIEFTLSVINTGNVTLTIAQITDTMTRLDTVPVALNAPFTFVSGDSNGDGRLGLTETWDYTARYTLTQDDVDAGGVRNTATIGAQAPNGAPVVDASDDGDDTDGNTTDDVTLVGLAAEPRVTAIKTLRSAGTRAGDEVVFDIVVRNSGDISLRDFAFTDTMSNAAGDDVSAGVSAPLLINGRPETEALRPTEERSYEVRYVLTQADVDAGGLSNSVTVQAQSVLGEPTSDISDSGDPADGAGASDPTRVTIVPAPSMSVVKTASDPTRLGNGIFDITFTLAVENTGNVTLRDMSMVDDLAAFAAPATLVSVSQLTAQGFVTGGVNAGFDGRADTQTLQSETAISPGETGQVTFTVRLDVSEAGTDNDNVVRVQASGIAGELSDTVTIEPLFEPNLTVAKSVSPSTARVGDIVTYTVQVANNGLIVERGLRIVDQMPAGLAYIEGSSRVGGDELPAPVRTGRDLAWQGLTIAGNGQLTITLQARVTERFGALTNAAWVETADGTRISRIAEAVLQVRPEAVFDCGDVIGRVFDDRNLNGYQDGAEVFRDAGVTDQSYDAGKFDAPPADAPRAEAGLPGVRVATTDGTVITTDEYGRFSVPCAALPADIGSNFVLKLDETSLPTGYHVTSENPRVLRLTPGILGQMNFGAALADVVDVSLTATAFPNSAPSTALVQGVDQLVARMSDAPTVLRLTYFAGVEGTGAGRARLDQLEALIRDRWRGTGSGRDLIIERTIAEIQ